VWRADRADRRRHLLLRDFAAGLRDFGLRVNFLNTKLLIVSAITIALAHGQGGGGKRVDIHDRVFDRTAYTFTIPANWSFQGAVVPGTSCEGSPFPVYRMSS